MEGALLAAKSWISKFAAILDFPARITELYNTGTELNVTVTVIKCRGVERMSEPQDNSSVRAPSEFKLYCKCGANVWQMLATIFEDGN